jgi:arylsulfatase A
MKPGPDEAGGNLSQDNLIFAQILQSAGYATAIAGKWQLYGTQEEYGFDESCMWEFHAPEEFDGPAEEKGASLPGRAARYWHPSITRNGKFVKTNPDDYGPDIFVDFINDFALRHKEGPFLIYYPMCLPHKSWDFDRKKNTWVPAPELDENGRRTDRKTGDTLKSNVEYTDYLIGRIVQNLEDLGIRDRTVLFFTGDNGTSEYGKGNRHQERGPRVPMIVSGPGIVKPMGPCDALTDFSDVLPTLTDLAGAELPEDYTLDGKSMAPVLRGERAQVREWIFCPFADKRFLRDTRWLLDGDGKFWDCGDLREEEGYVDVTDSKDTEVLAARARFEKLLEALPGPASDDPVFIQWQKRKARRGKP